ncbi:Pyruvate formate-lyase activating enzyme [Enhygromyxa salina]|uniref:Pyruvate formate-lyase activating enzyme n=1 Tax=Enhygromyxa salina TaxID=215803 RepID=A0A0C1ZSE3_9BACT|nr:glycyl-radical enzyme activating protein [Enhygromyxa salina]KIG13998.1 Pyruvate formate-lyase activating enzyme [Enhygromyxa salina]
MSSEDEAVVFDVQRFSVHDGPGIRTVVFFKGCALACRWCQNPESRRPQPELSYHVDRCLPGCRLCVSLCPEDAILDRMIDRVRWDACTHCSACVDVCPSNALVMVGERWTVERLLDAVIADRHFYATSGGGVTLSGGEPVLASEFLRGFLPRAKQAGLHLALETSGHYPFALLEPLLPDLDLILFDIKAGGRQRHLELVGHDSVQILANLERLLTRDGGPELEIRMAVVPGLNDGDASLDRICATLRELGVEQLTLLPYNHLWEAKLPRLDTEQVALGIAPPSEGYYRALEQRFADRGVTGLVGEALP